jgi:hypothetical protein
MVATSSLGLLSLSLAVADGLHVGRRWHEGPPTHSRRSAALRGANIVASGEEVSLGGLFGPSPSAGGARRESDGDRTTPVILQFDLDRLTRPGQAQQLHLYDTSNLSALRCILNKQSDTFVHVALDPEATAQRKFGIMSVGTECKVVGIAPSSKTNVRGEESASVLVDVLGLRPRRVLDVTQFEPHVRAILGPVAEE